MPRLCTRRWICVIASSVILAACGGNRPDQGQLLIPPLACAIQIEDTETTALDDHLVVLDRVTIPLSVDQEAALPTDVEWRDVKFGAVVVPQDDSRGAASYGAQLLISISIPPPPTAPVTAPSLLSMSDTYTLQAGQTFENRWYRDFTGRHRVDYPSIPGAKLAYECMVVGAEQATEQPER